MGYADGRLPREAKKRRGFLNAVSAFLGALGRLKVLDALKWSFFGFEFRKKRWVWFEEVIRLVGTVGKPLIQKLPERHRYTKWSMLWCTKNNRRIRKPIKLPVWNWKQLKLFIILKFRFLFTTRSCSNLQTTFTRISEASAWPSERIDCGRTRATRPPYRFACSSARSSRSPDRTIWSPGPEIIE